MNAALNEAPAPRTVSGEGEFFEVVTTPAGLHKVKDALTAAKFSRSKLPKSLYVPNSTVPLEADKAAKLLKLIETLEDNDDVQFVSHNADLPPGVGGLERHLP